MDFPSLTTAAFPAPPSVSPQSAREDEGKIREAANQFEALLVAQMLRNAREASAGEAETGGETAGALMEMAEESLAQVLAARGGLGIASMIMKQWKPAAPKVSEIPADKVQRKE
jgi:flagellar protein FlgJ